MCSPPKRLCLKNDEVDVSSTLVAVPSLTCLTDPIGTNGLNIKENSLGLRSPKNKWKKFTSVSLKILKPKHAQPKTLELASSTFPKPSNMPTQKSICHPMPQNGYSNCKETHPKLMHMPINQSKVKEFNNNNFNRKLSRKEDSKDELVVLWTRAGRENYTTIELLPPWK